MYCAKFLSYCNGHDKVHFSGHDKVELKAHMRMKYTPLMEIC